MLVPPRAMLIFATGQCKLKLEAALGYTQANLVDVLIAQDTIPFDQSLTAQAKLRAARSFAKTELLRVAGVRD